MTVKKKQKTAGGKQQPRGSARGFRIANDDLNAINDVAKAYEDPGECPLPQEEMDECVSEVMRLVLAHNEKKPLCPVPYSVISSRLKELQQRKSGIAKPIIAHAQKKLLNFGYELVEVKSGNVASYVLRSILPGQFLMEHGCSDEESAFAGLKLHITLYLHVKGDKATEAEMRKYLAQLGICLQPLKTQNAVKGGDIVDTFGVASPIQALIDQKFLKLGSTVAPDGTAEDVLFLGDAASGEVAEMTKSDTEAELKDLLAS